MLVLGISDLGPNAAAALLEGDRLGGAMEEEKLLRAEAAAGIPDAAIEFCLGSARAPANEISRAGLASRPKRAWLRDEGGRLTAFVSPLSNSHPVDTPDGLFWKLDQVRRLRQSLGPQVPLVNFEHHLCHGPAPFYPTQFVVAMA